MSFPQGTKVRLLKSWRVYSAGQILEQGFYADMEGLVKAGIAEKLGDEIEPGRPGKFARKAADKLAKVTRAAGDLLAT